MKAGWRLVKLGELCKTGAGGTPLKSKKEFYEGGSVPWLLSGEVAQGEILKATSFITQKGLENSSAKLFPPNTVLVAMYGATAGQVGVLRIEASTNQAVCGILPNEHFLPEFLFYYLLSRKDELIAQAAGNAQPNISQQKIRDTLVPVVPLPEQQRIVAILDEAFAAIAAARANAEQNRQNVRALFESYLQSVFSQRGEGWVERTLDEAVDQYCSLSYGIVQPGDEMADGLPIVRPTDLGVKVIELNGLKRIDANLADSYRRTTLRGNDLLLCVRGTTGLLSISSKTLLGGNVTRGIVPIHFEPSLLSQEFGYYLMRSEPVQTQIRKKTYGTALMQINIRDLRKLVISIPSLQKQHELVAKFDALWKDTQRLESLYQRKIEALDELKQSLLQQAFSGQL